MEGCSHKHQPSDFNPKGCEFANSKYNTILPEIWFAMVHLVSLLVGPTKQAIYDKFLFFFGSIASHGRKFPLMVLEWLFLEKHF